MCVIVRKSDIHPSSSTPGTEYIINMAADSQRGIREREKGSARVRRGTKTKQWGGNGHDQNTPYACIARAHYHV